jgi:hypothetical protein
VQFTYKIHQWTIDIPLSDSSASRHGQVTGGPHRWQGLPQDHRCSKLVTDWCLVAHSMRTSASCPNSRCCGMLLGILRLNHSRRPLDICRVRDQNCSNHAWEETVQDPSSIRRYPFLHIQGGSDPRPGEQQSCAQLCALSEELPGAVGNEDPRGLADFCSRGTHR